MINVLRASAGSGKTYNLARKYISIVLGSSDRYAYRHVLAVTFTNKATAEMKARILKELHILATDTAHSSYYKDFVPGMFPDAAALGSKAERVLHDILHDYSAFSISTIDKFFQQALRAFAKEIGYFASYQVQIDKDALIQETVDRILDGLTEKNADVLEWISETAAEELEQGHRFDMDKSLAEMGKLLKSTEHASLAGRIGMDDKEAYSKENVRQIRRACTDVMRPFARDFKERAAAVLEELNANGLSPEDTSRGWLGKIREYASISEQDTVERPSDAFLRNCYNPDKWFTKAVAKIHLSRVEPSLAPVLEHFADLFVDGDGAVSERYREYCSAALINGTVQLLGLAREFYNGFDALVKEKNIMSLDDANTILKRIIDGSDIPFVYEKLGVRYEHFLLDEFQDTSGVQWDNFKPLLRESVSHGRENLVVGDIKQSIYRWRGSDWHLLADLPSDFEGDVSLSTLADNYRSLKTIVGFNNDFFPFYAGALDSSLDLSGSGSISDIYSDVVQTPKTGDGQEGCVSVSFCSDDDSAVLNAMVDSVREAREAGAQWRDIAVLVRGHKDGAAVADALVAAEIPIISDDSLHIKSSFFVRQIVSLMSCVDNPEDTVSSYLAQERGLEYTAGYHSLVDLCESLIRCLIADGRGMSGGEELYLQAFMDIVQEWSSVNGNDLSGFLRHWAQLDSKIVSPEDADAVTIMTIHKSKGLQFPYVIFPFAESIGTPKPGADVHWCIPEIEEGNLGVAGGVIYPISVSSKLQNSCFSESYRQEGIMRAVDDINMAYVAFTRAEKCLHVIATRPKDSVINAIQGGGLPKSFNLAAALYKYVSDKGVMNNETARFGTMYSFGVEVADKGESAAEQSFSVSYRSVSIGDRLSFGEDNADFFGTDGDTAPGRSPRLRGIVMHDILSMIDSPAQLRAAVDAAVLNGELTAADGEEAFTELYAKVSDKVACGWFAPEAESAPGAEVSSAGMGNEVSVFDTDGALYRPDRVVTGADGSVTVIDYKFGEERPKYLSQVRKYMSLYRRMGCENVRGYLWYVDQDLVREVGQGAS